MWGEKKSTFYRPSRNKPFSGARRQVRFFFRNVSSGDAEGSKRRIPDRNKEVDAFAFRRRKLILYRILAGVFDSVDKFGCEGVDET